ncbi:MAG: TonB-dependent receptor [Ignavibacteria bacterium]|nr:TonB-dependent receptor [Ignavibacteria bacterium]
MSKTVIHIVCLLAASVSFLFSGKTEAQEKDTTSHVYRLPEIIITALRVPVKESSVPYSVTMMETRKNIQGLSLAEAVAGLPGLEVNARYNLSVGDRITNRGFGARTQFGVRGVRIIADDIPVTMADGQTNLEMIDLQDLSYVELLRGPGSSLYGNSSGGVLKLYSTPLPSAPFHFSLSSTNGADGLFRLNGTIGGTFAKIKVSGSFTDFNYEGYREHSKSNLKRAVIKLSSSLSPSDILLVSTGYVHFVALSTGSLTKQEAEQNPKLANPLSIKNMSGENGTQFQVSAAWTHRYDSISLLTINVYDSYRSVRNPIVGKIIELPQNDGGIDAFYYSKVNIMGKRIDWSVGAEAGLRLNNRKNYINNNGSEGALFIDQNERIINSGLFTQTIVPVTPEIDVAGSIRYDQTYFGVTDFLSNSPNTDNSGNRTMTGISPALGIVYRFSNTLNFFANVSTSFETPTSTELANRPGGIGGFNPNLNPSHALEYEAGIRGSFSTILQYDLTGYIINIKDELIPFEVISDSSGGQVYYRNAGSAVHRGVELSIIYYPLSSLKALISLTYIDADFKTYVVNGLDYSGNKVPGITPLRITAELTYNTPFEFYVSLLMQTSGKVTANDANTAYADSKTVLNFDIGHDGISFGKNKKIKLMLSGGISNIFDTHYISSVSINAAAGRYYEPAPGRSFFLNARLVYK